MSNPVDVDDELERKLMDLFAKCTSFGFSFGHSTSKEEFAEMLSNGESKDHQEAAHEAMQLIQADRKKHELQARIDQVHRDFLRHSIHTEVDESLLIEIRDAEIYGIEQELEKL